MALIHLLSLLTGALYLVRVNRDQWFYGDEWDFLGGARRHLPWYDQLLTPHNEHWSTAPYLVYRVLEANFGIRSYWPYFLTAIVLHLVVVHLVWWVMLQSGSDPFVATVVVLPLIVLGAGAPGPALGVPDRVPRFTCPRPRRTPARQPRGRVEAP